MQTRHSESWHRGQAARIVALAMIAATYAVARPPSLAEPDRRDLAARYRFERADLPELPGGARRSIREVHPSLRPIAAWISAVGASVALHDLDGDGLPNDVAIVDTRSDRVGIAPVPGTPRRFEPFELVPNLPGHDPRTTAPMGCLPGDLNEDGLADLLVYYWGRSPVAFLRIDPGASGPIGPACYRAVDLAPGSGRWYSNAATLADLDGDGHLDLVVGNYFPDDCRVLDPDASGRERMQRSMSRAFNGGRNRLLRWAGASAGPEPDIRFEEVRGAIDDDVAHAWTLALGAADLDGDLLPELYFANDFGPDRLLHNRSEPGRFQFALLEGRKTLTTPTSKVLGRDSFKGMGIDFGDLDGDGILDFYVSNIAQEYALEESHFAFVGTGELARMRDGHAPYVDRSEPLGLARSGWGWDAKLADFDNDGQLEVVQAVGFARGTVNRWPELQELAMGNDELLAELSSWPRFGPGDDLSGGRHNPFFARSDDGRFWDIAPLLGFREAGVSRGIATADVDGDGRLDLAVANQWAGSSFYRNRADGSGAFLGLHLRLPITGGPGEGDGPLATPGRPAAEPRSRPAVGAAATVFLPDGRRLVAQVDGGNGHSGRRSPDLHFGLGRLEPSDRVRVEIRWRNPSGLAREGSLELTPGWHTVQLGW